MMQDALIQFELPWVRLDSVWTVGCILGTHYHPTSMAVGLMGMKMPCPAYRLSEIATNYSVSCTTKYSRLTRPGCSRDTACAPLSSFETPGIQALAWCIIKTGC
jgi:hypothetical protein